MTVNAEGPAVARESALARLPLTGEEVRYASVGVVGTLGGGRGKLFKPEKLIVLSASPDAEVSIEVLALWVGRLGSFQEVGVDMKAGLRRGERLRMRQ